MLWRRNLPIVTTIQYLPPKANFGTVSSGPNTFGGFLLWRQVVITLKVGKFTAKSVSLIEAYIQHEMNEYAEAEWLVSADLDEDSWMIVAWINGDDFRCESFFAADGGHPNDAILTIMQRYDLETRVREDRLNRQRQAEGERKRAQWANEHPAIERQVA